ncbi:MAG: ABC transporter substrate-binding protein [Tissierellia bacterium]|nr:ABC transporter substrate-binding protein [Tissierellia bacterium]
MKKLIIAILILSLLTACGGANEPKEEKLKIGVVQLMEHLALDDCYKGFEEELENLGIECEIIYKNAQGDIATARTISEKLVQDEVDLIFAIATGAAEAAVSTGTDIPILFSAVTDPIEAHLVESLEEPGANCSGTSDAADVLAQLKIFKELDPEIETIGIIYSSDEINSLVQVEEVEKYAPECGLKVETSAIANISDLPQIAQSLVKKVDALYIPSDNKIAGSISLLADILIKEKMISVCAEESQVTGGGLITNGISYYDLGAQTAKMAKRVLVDGEDISKMPVEKGDNPRKVVNEETMKALDLEIE